MAWKKQGSAFTHPIRFSDGRVARVVMVGPRSNPRGAMVAVPDVEGNVELLNQTCDHS